MENTTVGTLTPDDLVQNERSRQSESILKWGSYFFIGSFGLGLSFIPLRLLGIQNIGVVYFLLVLTLFYAVYCTQQCALEQSKFRLVSLFTKLKIFLEIIVLYLFFQSLLTQDNGDWFPLQLPKRELELQECEASAPEKNNNLLRDFILFLRKK